jgi:Lipopolysaccharide export system permease LptF/LptG
MKGSLDRLRALAARMLPLRTMERVIDPLLADLQMEYADANRRGRVWKRRWTLIAGHVVFLKTVALCEAEDVMTLFDGWPADDVVALKRTLSVSIVAVMVTTVVLEMPPLWNFPFAMSNPKTILYLLPQALVLALPMGFTVGLFYSMRGRIVSFRSRVAVMAGATILSLASLAMLAWVVPLANQEFRQVVFGHVSENDGAVLMKGVNELTLGELSERIGAYRGTGVVRRDGQVLDSDPRELAYSYHQRWALSCASVILAMFALSMTQRMVTGWVVGLGALGTLLIYYVLLWSGRAGVLQHSLPAFVGAWLPNALFAIVCVAVMAATSRRVPPPGVSAPAPGDR